MGFKVIEAGIFLTETLDYFLECLCGRHKDIVSKFDTSVSHIFEGFDHQMRHMTGFHLF